MQPILAIIVIISLGTWLFIISVPGLKDKTDRLKFFIGKIKISLPNFSKRLTKEDKYTIRVTGLLLLTAGVFFAYVAIPKFVLDANPENKQPDKYLGYGWADLNGPSSIPVGGSASVVLTISLSRDYIQIPIRFTDEERPPIIAVINPKDPSFIEAREERIPIYERMRAKLDAPAFEYSDRDWVWQNVPNRADWVWNIMPKQGSIGPQALTVYLNGPENSGYRNIKFLMIITVGQTAIITPTPAMAPTATFTPTVIADTTAPSMPTNLSYATTNISTVPSFTWRAAIDDASGVDHYEVRVDSEPFVDIGNVLTHTRSIPLEAGSYTFYVRAVDKAGNTGTTASVSFNIISSTPTAAATVAPTPVPVAPPAPRTGAMIGWVLGIMVAVAVVVVIVILLAKRKPQ